MNERISALLVRLGADPALRARFEQAAADVMAEAGLTAEEQTELLRQMKEGTSRGRIFAASAVEPSSESREGRIHAPEASDDAPTAESEAVPANWSAKVYGDSPDDVPAGSSGAATGETPDDVSDKVFGDSADDSPRDPSRQ
jgi:hypothetical protein